MKTCALCKKKIRKVGGRQVEVAKTKHGNYLHTTCIKLFNEWLALKEQKAAEGAKAPETQCLSTPAVDLPGEVENASNQAD